jgi:hypothetical protein
MKTKICSKCKAEKACDEFYVSSRRCKDCHKAYAESNKERIRIRKAAYYLRTKEDRKKAAEAYRNKDGGESNRKRAKEYYEQNTEKVREYRSEYAKGAGYWVHRLSRSKTHAKQSGVKVIEHITHQELLDHWKSIGQKPTECHICGHEDEDRFFQLDHVIPRTDPNCTHTVDNLLPACPLCNNSKN